MRVELSDSAQRAIKGLQTPLVAEILLIFSCLVVKRVWFKESVDRAF